MTANLTDRYVAAYRTAIDPMKPYSSVYAAQCEMRSVTSEAAAQGVTLDLAALEQQARTTLYAR